MDTTTLARPALTALVADIRRITARGRAPRATARTVADAVRDAVRDGRLTTAILTPGELAGHPDHHAGHLLHAEDAFSVMAVVWRPGQETAIHDHVAWCAFAVLSGIESETLYRVEGDHLVEIGRAANRPGDVSGFAPPGDIHSVRNTSAETGVSLHVYGADLSLTGSSVRRVYDLPVR